MLEARDIKLFPIGHALYVLLQLFFCTEIKYFLLAELYFPALMIIKFFYRLSKVKRWSKTYEKLPDDPADSKWPAQKSNKNLNFIPSSESVVENEKSNSVCKLKYQQSTIDVSYILVHTE